MEKLQKALQKARDQRANTLDQPGLARPRPTNGTAAPTPAEGSAAELWAELRGFEPSAKTLEKHRIVSAASSRLSTHFDILRTKILLTMRKNGWKRLAVTSPTMGCGKSTTACNLTIGCARNPEIRTMLFEFDLRRPSIAKTLDLPAGPDITELLSGEVGFSDQAIRYSQNVAVAAAQKSSSDPTPILLSRQTHDVLDDVEAQYAADLMIFDLPPLLVSDDTRAVLKDVDCALVVARAGSTTLGQIDSSEREIIEHTNMIGVVLNQCRDAEEIYDYYE